MVVYRHDPQSVAAFQSGVNAALKSLRSISVELTKTVFAQLSAFSVAGRTIYNLEFIPSSSRSKKRHRLLAPDCLPGRFGI